MSDAPQFLYALPTDADERRRLDLQHRCLTLVFGGLCCCPGLVEAVLSEPANPSHAIIDIGTGSGAWAQDIANAYPDADVTGVDIVPPESSRSTPNNCRFYFEDVNKGFGHYEKLYSVVHMRMIAQGVDDFRGALHNVAEILRPGGILLTGAGSLDVYDENKEPYPELIEGETGWSAIKAIWTLFQVVLKELADVNVFHEWTQWLREDSMYDSASVGDEVFYIPIGPWRSGKPGYSPSEVEAGRILRDNFMKLIPYSVDIIAKHGALDSNTLDRWLKAAIKQMDEMNPPMYGAVVMTWAKRSNVGYSQNHGCNGLKSE